MRGSARCRRLLLTVAVAVMVLFPAAGPWSVRAAQDKSAVELVVRGCLKGRDVTAVDISGPDDLPDYTGGIFRLSAKGEINRLIKQHNGRLVDVTGRVKKTALAEPGFKLGGARIVIGGPRSTDPTRDPARNPPTRLLPMEVTALSVVAEACPAWKR